MTATASVTMNSNKVTRGTYSNPVCVVSAASTFAEKVSFGLVANGVINMYPESIAAGLGDDSACGMLGAVSTA